MRGRQWKAFALATVAALALGACGGDDAADDTAGEAMPQAEEPMSEAPQQVADLPEGVTQEQFQQGQQLFTGQGACVACHGPEATGTPLAPDLTDDQWINLDGRDYDAILELIRTGVPQPVEHPGPMPPMGGASLDDEQIRALGAYVYGISQG